MEDCRNSYFGIHDDNFVIWSILNTIIRSMSIHECSWWSWLCLDTVVSIVVVRCPWVSWPVLARSPWSWLLRGPRSPQSQTGKWPWKCQTDDWPTPWSDSNRVQRNLLGNWESEKTYLVFWKVSRIARMTTKNSTSWGLINVSWFHQVFQWWPVLCGVNLIFGHLNQHGHEDACSTERLQLWLYFYLCILM